MPAMGWQPTKVQSRPLAISKQRSQMTRLTPTASMTIAPPEILSAMPASQSMLTWG